MRAKRIEKGLRGGPGEPGRLAAFERADARQRSLIDELLGDAALDEAGVNELREVITLTGAVADSEQRIELLLAESLSAIESAPIAEDALQITLKR